MAYLTTVILFLIFDKYSRCIRPAARRLVGERVYLLHPGCGSKHVSRRWFKALTSLPPLVWRESPSLQSIWKGGYSLLFTKAHSFSLLSLPRCFLDSCTSWLSHAHGSLAAVCVGWTFFSSGLTASKQKSTEYVQALVPQLLLAKKETCWTMATACVFHEGWVTSFSIPETSPAIAWLWFCYITDRVVMWCDVSSVTKLSAQVSVFFCLSTWFCLCICLVAM